MKAKLEIDRKQPQLYINNDGDVLLSSNEGEGTVVHTLKSNWGMYYINLDFSDRDCWTPIAPGVLVVVHNTLRGKGGAYGDLRDSLFPSLYRNRVDGSVILYTSAQVGTLLVPVAGEEYRIGEFSAVWESCTADRSNWTRLPVEASVTLEQE